MRRSSLAILVLLGLAWLTPSRAWHYIGLSGSTTLSVDNHERDLCDAATDQALIRIYDRGAWWDTLYVYGQHQGTHACVRTRTDDPRSIYLAWGWGSRSDGLWFSPDGASSWSVLKYLLFPSVVALAPANSNLVFLGSDTMEQGLWRSTDRGQNWSRADSGLPTTNIRALEFPYMSGSTIACGTRGRGLYVSTDLGTSWSVAGPDSLMDVRGVEHWYPGYVQVVGDVALNPSRSGIWFSTDLGTSWRQELALEGGSCIRGRHAGFSRGMYWGVDTVWEPVPEWPSGLAVSCISSAAHDFYYAGSTDGVWHHDECPGIEESCPQLVTSAGRGGTIVRGCLVLTSAAGAGHEASGVLVDAAGRRVIELRPGANNVRHLGPGVYFVRSASGVERDASSVYKVVITR
jgi:hypothetical protein